MVKNPPANARDTGEVGSIPGLGRCPEVENGNSLQYSCLGNSTDRGAWPATVHRVARVRHDPATKQQHYIEHKTELMFTRSGVLRITLCLVSA